MELLYVVELEVRSAPSAGLTPAAVRDRILTRVAEWLSFEHEPALDSDGFAADGQSVLKSERGDRPDARVRWTTEGDGHVQAISIEVRRAITPSGRADFVCAITVLSVEPDVTFRVELARESLGGVLAPAPIEFFRRPYLLMLLLRDRDLEYWAGPSRVDGRFNWVNRPHADFVWEALSAESRLLPVLLVDGSNEAGESLARRAAGELIGLAPVLAVDGRAQERLDGRLDSIGATIPFDGARLVWPDLSLRHPSFTADLASVAPARLLRMLSSVSVTVRGVNQLQRRATAAQRAARNSELVAELESARAVGDVSREVAAQADIIRKLESEVEQYVAWIQEVENERDDYKTKASSAAYLQQELDLLRRSAGVRTPDWSEAPPLDSFDLTDLAAYLTKHSQGAVVFTRNAHQSWKKDAYPKVNAMREALIDLAKAAVEYRRLGCQLGMVPDDWFKHEWGLNLASSDKFMSKNGLADFDHEGKTYNRLPHLKLGDHVSPNEVGRIYFAMDSEGERFIVDHVGLKLHGL